MRLKFGCNLTTKLKSNMHHGMALLWTEPIFAALCRYKQQTRDLDAFVSTKKKAARQGQYAR